MRPCAGMRNLVDGIALMGEIVLDRVCRLAPEDCLRSSQAPSFEKRRWPQRTRSGIIGA